MTGNRSLDEFRPGGSDGADEAEPADDAASSEAAAAVEPIASTCDWSPGGAPCGSCGAVAEERWRDGDGLVCADCKEW